MAGGRRRWYLSQTSLRVGPAPLRRPAHRGGAGFSRPPPPPPPCALGALLDPLGFLPVGSPRVAFGCRAPPRQPAPRAASGTSPGVAGWAGAPRVGRGPFAPMPRREELSGCRWLELRRCCPPVAIVARTPVTAQFYVRTLLGCV